MSTATAERLIALSERLADALETDIAALKRGNPREMRTLDPEIQRLTAMYSREALALNNAATKALPPEPRGKLTAATKRFRDALTLHARMLTRVRNASEGMIRAVAEEVERSRATTRIYSPAMQSPRAASAMIYNNVI